MKTVEIRSNSWHCRIARLGGHREWRDTDICQYTRDFIWGALLGLVVGACSIVVIGMMIILTGAFIYQVFGSIIYGTWLLDDPGLAGGFFWFVIGIVVFAHMASNGKVEWVNKLQNRPYKEPQEPGFVKVAYRAWKDKFCFRITTN